VKIALTQAQVAHILACLHARDEGNDAGWYYGSKAHFEKRHKTIKDALYAALARSCVAPISNRTHD